MNNTQKEILLDKAINELQKFNNSNGYGITGLKNATKDYEYDRLKQPIENLLQDTLEFLYKQIVRIEYIQNILQGVK